MFSREWHTGSQNFLLLWLDKPNCFPLHLWQVCYHNNHRHVICQLNLTVNPWLIKFDQKLLDTRDPLILHLTGWVHRVSRHWQDDGCVQTRGHFVLIRHNNRFLIIVLRIHAVNFDFIWKVYWNDMNIYEQKWAIWVHTMVLFEYLIELIPESYFWTKYELWN